VRVGPDERVGEGAPLARLDDAAEVLEVDLVADAGVRRHDLEVREAGLAPAQERVALAVALELELSVAPDRSPGRELVDLHRVVDHELRRQLRVDPCCVATEVAHSVAHRCEIDDRRDAGEILEQDARRRELDLVRRIRLRVPARNRLHVLVPADAEGVLEQDLERVRESRHVVTRLERIEAEDLVLLAPDAQDGAGAEGVGHGTQSTGGGQASACPPRPSRGRQPTTAT
jgi:hypothetical protein